MSKLFSQFFVLLLSITSSITFAETKTEKSLTILEKTKATIIVNGNTPYVELRLCSSCPLRLLPFAESAQVNIDGQYIEHNMLQNGQQIIGAVFIQEHPVTSINRITGN